MPTTLEHAVQGIEPRTFCFFIFPQFLEQIEIERAGEIERERHQQTCFTTLAAFPFVDGEWGLNPVLMHCKVCPTTWLPFFILNITDSAFKAEVWGTTSYLTKYQRYMCFSEAKLIPAWQESYNQTKRGERSITVRVQLWLCNASAGPGCLSRRVDALYLAVQGGENVSEVISLGWRGGDILGTLWGKLWELSERTSCAYRLEWSYLSTFWKVPNRWISDKVNLVYETGLASSLMCPLDPQC